jgi:hypothetical protein
MIDNLEVDAGISYLDNEPMGRVTTVPLYRGALPLRLRRHLALRGPQEVGWEEIAGEKLCLLTPDMQNRRIINQNFLDAGVTPKAKIESNSTVVLMAHVGRATGLTVLPAQMAAFLAAGKPLVIMPLRASRCATMPWASSRPTASRTPPSSPPSCARRGDVRPLESIEVFYRLTDQAILISISLTRNTGPVRSQEDPCPRAKPCPPRTEIRRDRGRASGARGPASADPP